MKKIIATILAFAIMVSSTAPAFAADTIINEKIDVNPPAVTESIATNGGNSSVPVELTAEATLFSATVPTGLPVWVDAVGEVTTATDVKILNNSYGPIEIKGVTVEPKNDWVLADFTKDFSKDKVGLKEFGFHLQGANVKTDGSCAVSGFDVINGNSSISLTYDANVAIQKTVLTDSNIANVVFTIGWSTGEAPEVPEIPEVPEEPETPPVEPEVPVVPEISGITAVGYNGVYDGKAHSVTVSAPEGATVKYTNENTLTNVGKTTVEYTVSMPDHKDFTGSAIIEITPKPVTVAAQNSTSMYGQTINLGDVKITGIVVGEESLFDAKFTATTTATNKSPVGEYDITVNGDYSNENYTITKIGAKHAITEIVYTDITVAAYNRHKIGFKGTAGEELVIPETFQDTDGIWYRVTAIEANTFEGCNKLKSVVIPNTVTSIGYWAFAFCDALESVTILSGGATRASSDITGAFYGCASLKSVILPDNLTVIGDSTFSACSSLTSIVIPNSVTEISNTAFSDTSTNINIDNTKDAIPDAPWGSTGVVTWLRGENYKDFTITYSNRGKIGFTGATGEILKIPETFQDTDGTRYKVVGIADSAFYECSRLISVHVPDSITSIGKSTFALCRSMKYVKLPKNLEKIEDSTFNSCWALNTIIWPENIKSIGKYAFGGTQSLTSVSIPDGVENILAQAFQGSTVLQTINIPNSVNYIAPDAFNANPITDININKPINSIYDAPWGAAKAKVNWAATSETEEYKPFVVEKYNRGKIGFKGVASENLVIPETFQDTDGTKYRVVGIGERAFADCTMLWAINIPNSVVNINSSAFSGCTNLVYLTLSSNLEYIGGGAFESCTKLSALKLPSSITYIGSGAFNRCNALTAVTIPGGVRTLLFNTFNGCKNLKSVTIEEGITQLPDSIFNDCPKLTTVFLPNSLEKIGARVFKSCIALTGIDIPNSVVTIGDNAFEGCSSLTSIVLPENMETISGSLFKECRNLSSVTLPANAKTIGNDAFFNCSGLRSINIPNKVETIGSWSFYGCSGLSTIDIPSSVNLISRSYNTFAFCTYLKTINVHKPANSLDGWPWGAPSKPTVNWLG